MRPTKYNKHQIINGKKICNTCKEERPVESFGKDKRNSTGLNYSCKPCIRKQENPRNRERSIKKYGITKDQYDRMVQDQHNKCAICGNGPEKSRSGVLAIDHCHNSKKVRQLLCTNCNIMIGLAYDNKDILIQAVAYLEKHQ